MRTHIGNVPSREDHDGQRSSGREFPLLIGIVVLALVTRLAVAVLTTSWAIPSERHFWAFGYEMGQIAASVAMGHGFGWPDWSSYPPGLSAWMPPVYPLVMAVMFKIFGIYSQQAAIALELLQTILSALTCVVLYALGKRLYHAQAGLLAAGFFAIYPPAIYYAVGMIWGTSLFVFCLLLVMLMFLQQADYPHVKGGIGLGILLGFTALVDPVSVSVYPFACAWLYFKAAGDRRFVVKTIAVMLIAFGIAISPWIMRNYVAFGRFVFIKSNLGAALVMGNNVYATGDHRDSFSTDRDKNEERVVFTEAEQTYLKRADEATRQHFLLRKGINFILENPLRFIQLTVKRFILYWTFMRPVAGWQAMVSQIAYFMVLGLAVVGLILNKAKRPNLQLVLLFLLLLPVPYYFTIVGIFRYRFPIESILIIFAGYTIYWIASRPLFSMQSQRQ